MEESRKNIIGKCFNAFGTLYYVKDDKDILSCTLTEKSVELLNVPYGKITVDILAVCPEVDPSVIFQIAKLVRMNYMTCAAILKDTSEQAFIYKTLILRTARNLSLDLERFRVIGEQFMDLGDGFDFMSLYHYPNASEKVNVPEEYIPRLESVITETFRNIKNLWITKVGDLQE